MSTLTPEESHAGDRARGPSFAARFAPAIAAAAAVTLVGVWGGLGPLSLPGLALVAACTLGAGWLVLSRAPWLPLFVTPLLLPLPQVGVFFPFEMMLCAGAALLALHLVHHRSERIGTAPRWEIANACFVAWALFTTFWAFDGLHVFLGVRRLLVGVLAAAVAWRMAGALPKRAFEASIAFTLISIAGAALQRSIATGFSAQTALFHRASATDLGWGTANFIASLLLLLTPTAFALLISARPWWLRAASATGILLAGLLQVLVASRAATVLFLLGLIVQSFLSLRRRARWFGVSAVVLGTTGALLTPYGQGFLSRFSNLRDLGSMVIRVWYFREGWRRVQEFFWFGMGLNQGIPYPDKMSGIDLHNYWLVVTSELGLPGLLLWSVTLALQFRALSRMRRLDGFGSIGLALQVSFWLGQLHTLVEPTFQGVQYQFLWFWIAAGFLGYAEREAASASNAAASAR